MDSEARNYYTRESDGVASDCWITCYVMLFISIYHNVVEVLIEIVEILLEDSPRTKKLKKEVRNMKELIRLENHRDAELYKKIADEDFIKFCETHFKMHH